MSFIVRNLYFIINLDCKTLPPFRNLTNGDVFWNCGGGGRGGEEGRVVVGVLEVDADICVRLKLPVRDRHTQAPLSLAVGRVAIQGLRGRGGGS